jgi:dTMP kinase
MAGLFVTLEGIDRAGKSTQAALLADALGAVAVREPGGTEAGERIRDILKDPATTLSLEAEALLFAAARAELVRQVIRPALEAGQTVVCDRFLDSSLAYQGVARGMGVDAVRRINEPAVGDLVPDLTVLLVLGHVAAAERGTERDRFEREGGSLQRAVAEGYETLAAAEPGRWRRLDAGRDPQAVHADILAAVREAGG